MHDIFFRVFYKNYVENLRNTKIKKLRQIIMRSKLTLIENCSVNDMESNFDNLMYHLVRLLIIYYVFICKLY